VRGTGLLAYELVVCAPVVSSTKGVSGTNKYGLGLYCCFCLCQSCKNTALSTTSRARRLHTRPGAKVLQDLDITYPKARGVNDVFFNGSIIPGVGQNVAKKCV
jgi:hypothetical protein